MPGTRGSDNQEHVAVEGEETKIMGPSSTEGSSALRRRREEDATSPVTSNKRLKTASDAGTDAYDDPSYIGATELASAFALASLATLSPMGHRHRSLAVESRDSDFGDEDSGSAVETRSPKEDPVPVTPDIRSDSRLNKKVTFSRDTKSIERQGARRFAFPPRSPQASRMPIGFRRGGFVGRAHPLLPPPPPLPHHAPPMHWQISPQHHHHHLHRQRMISMPPPGFMPPPPPPSLIPSSPVASNQWACDYCQRPFMTYNDALVHEDSCSVRCNSVASARRGFHAAAWHHPPALALPSMDTPHVPPEPPVAPNSLPSASSREWNRGATSLEVPETDPDWLSDLNCYIRRECIEAFSATDDQANRASKRGRIAPGQVGVRCRFCAHRPADERPVGAASFPTSLAGIYESVKRWQRVHMETCEDLPHEVRDALAQLSSNNVWIPTTRQYWVDSARALGMVDTDDGIRFARDPSRRPGSGAVPGDASSPLAAGESTSAADAAPTAALPDGKSIVHPDDYAMVPPYVYFLMSQVEACCFTEADRFVARSKGPVGYPGFQCKHCNGHAGLGKYFPITSKSLSTNSTSQNIHAHVLKCRKCPLEVKRRLVELKDAKSKAPRLEPGWRKVFFDKVWSRLHG